MFTFLRETEEQKPICGKMDSPTLLLNVPMEPSRRASSWEARGGCVNSALSIVRRRFSAVVRGLLAPLRCPPVEGSEDDPDDAEELLLEEEELAAAER